MSMTTLKVPNISCGHCTATITKELSPLAGVNSVDAAADTKLVVVDVADDDTLARVKATLVDIGFPAEE